MARVRPVRRLPPEAEGLCRGRRPGPELSTNAEARSAQAGPPARHGRAYCETERRAGGSKLAVALKAPLELTWSCYDPQQSGAGWRVCGRCDACRLRQKGFAEAGERGRMARVRPVRRLPLRAKGFTEAGVRDPASS